MADGLHFLKFFPATAAGGVPMLKALAGPFPDVVFCPTGGITAETAPQFLALPNVKVCGGSWLTPADALAAGRLGPHHATGARGHGADADAGAPRTSAPIGSSPSPSATPWRSAALRFWLTFHLPISARRVGISMPTIARSICCT